MKIDGIAQALHARQESAGLSASDVAKLAGCTVPQAVQVLAGDPDAQVGVVAAVCAALGCDLVALVPDEFLRDVLYGLQDVDTGRVIDERELETTLRRPDIVSRPGSVTAKQVDFEEPLPKRVQSGAGQDSHWLSPATTEELGREERRLALHEAAVGVLERHPERAETVLEVLERWIARGFPNQALANDWRRIIETRDWDAILERSDAGRRLRQGSPLVFVLEQEERLAIIRRFARTGARDG